MGAALLLVERGSSHQTLLLGQAGGDQKVNTVPDALRAITAGHSRAQRGEEGRILIAMEIKHGIFRLS